MTDTPQLGSRGIYVADVEQSLPYGIFDADHHLYAPADAVTRYLAPEMVERAWLPGEPRMLTEEEHDEDVDHERRTLGVHSAPEGGFGGVDLSQVSGMDGNIPIPGAMLNKLNPMKDLDQLSREQLIERYNAMRPAFEKKDPRLALMDLQNVELAVLHTVGTGWESAFGRGDIEAGYAVNRAYNDWLFEDWGFAHENRILVPVPIPLLDVDYAVAELKRSLERGAKFVDLQPGPAWNGRSPFDPYFDPFWNLVNESNTRVAVHLGGTYARHGAEWGEKADARYVEFNGFQWVSYWGDRPMMDTLTSMFYHGMFGRFPNIKVLIAEFGTVWLPYLLRKLDHAMLLGRKPKWGTLPGRPSSVFKERCVIAPFPEEDINRGIDTVGADCLVFGSDFPHSEGVPDPMQYVALLKDLDDATIRKIMRDNLVRFMG
ncbi:amidohydrolase family protein [Pseudofrankia inefficax]|uniref:Amidohydrolase 2 n=1 Tax=Pseudofrankia inefficax (strain DSM 45817 / CECT 9037 / DDB 130130 / EuI1c) TaxID=298654 RepID=E3J896_PSEI1|nr:amidohydrolase family protein [Pseudofrankia inefficax]ADP83289.1 amidohydrolase 2 [Pseudofrankia inefficax]